MKRWQDIIFRPTKSRSKTVLALCTFQQTVLFWGFFLALVPWAIVSVQRPIGVPIFDPGSSKWLAFALFWALGATALYCASLFVRFGCGTPLPLDQTTRLVVLGPYRVVRNPMAICGIFQGVMVGWFLGSWPVMIYAVCGAIVWHVVARVPEEEDLRRRFGEQYENYHREVPIWLPTRKPYPKVLPANQNPKE